MEVPSNLGSHTVPRPLALFGTLYSNSKLQYRRCPFWSSQHAVSLTASNMSFFNLSSSGFCPRGESWYVVEWCPRSRVPQTSRCSLTRWRIRVCLPRMPLVGWCIRLYDRRRIHRLCLIPNNINCRPWAFFYNQYLLELTELTEPNFTVQFCQFRFSGAVLNRTSATLLIIHTQHNPS